MLQRTSITTLFLYCLIVPLGSSCGKFINDAVMYFAISRMKEPHSVLLFDLWSSWETVPSLKEAVANPLPKHVQFGWWSSPVNCYQVHEGGCRWLYMGTANNSKETRHDVQICVIYNMKKQVIKYVAFQKLEVALSGTNLVYSSTPQL